MRTRNAGFTLVEIMVVVTLMGVLAGLARLSVQRINLRTRSAAFNNDCRVFSEAFQRYSLEKGGFPADQTTVGTLPAGMSGYITDRVWLRPTPIGGTYDWDNKDATNSTGATFDAAIKVSGCTWPVASLLQLDSWFDDGDLSSGHIIATDAGTTVLFLIEGGAGGVASSPTPTPDPSGGDDISGGAPSIWFLSLLATAAAARAYRRRVRL